MNKCPRCGKVAETTDRFCGACGYNLMLIMQDMAKTQKDIKVKDVRFSLGVVYFKMGKFAQAIETFEKILEEDPENIQILAMLEQAKQAQQKVISEV